MAESMRAVPVAERCQAAACRAAGNAHVRGAGDDGISLCGACRESTGELLRALPHLYEECGRMLSSSGGPRERTSGGPLPGMPFNTAATEVRSGIVTTLASWSGLVAQERGMAAPARTVPVLARWLVEHLEWLAAHPAAGEFSAELHRWVRAARRVTSSGAVRRVPLGTCVESGCGGTLVARTGGPSAGAAEIRCDADAGHRWAEYEWAQLRGRMTPPGTGGTRRTQWVSPQDVARIWRVSLGSVYRLASENTWGRRRVGGRSHYDEADVRRTLSARMAGRSAAVTDVATGTRG